SHGEQRGGLRLRGTYSSPLRRLLRSDRVMKLSLESMTERERRMVMAGGALAAALLIFGIIVPLDRSVAHVHERVGRKQADLVWMRGVAPELAAAGPQATASGGSLLVIVDRSARESGLGASLAGSEPSGAG